MEQILFSADLKMLQNNVRSFVKDFVLPVERNNRDYASGFSPETLGRLQNKAKEMGLWAFGAKKEWGGAELSLFEQVVLFEEAVSHNLGFYSTCLGALGPEYPKFLDHCTHEQKEIYIKPTIEAGKDIFVAVFEELESNNLHGIECQAERNDSCWVLNGSKSYVANVENAKIGVVLVNCGQNSEEKLPTLFIVERESLQAIRETRLMNVRSVYQVEFNNLKVDDSQRIGDIGAGIKIISSWIAQKQIILAAKSIGIAKRALEMTQNYVSLRTTRGKPLAEFPSIQAMIAQSVAELKSVRFLVWDAAFHFDRNDELMSQSARISKLMATEAAFNIVDRCLQCHGGAGFSGDLPFERWYKELRIARSDFENKNALQEKIASYALKNRV